MNNTTESTSVQNEAGSSSLSTSETVVAVVVPLLLITSLMILFIFLKRRRRRTRTTSRDRSAASTTQNNDSQSSNLTLSERASTYTRRFRNFFDNPQTIWRSESRDNTRNIGDTSTDSDQTRVHVRSTGRRQRPRRTDSGATVKTLPEYNDLGDDEVMLFKATFGDSITDLEGGNAQAEVNTPNRQLSLRAVADLFRRISLRRNDHAEGVDTSNNEMNDMRERNNDTEESNNHPQEEAPQYNEIYPTLPPQIQVSNFEGNNVDMSNRRLATRSIFRRSGSTAQRDGLLGGMDSYTADSTTDLRLTTTRSTDPALSRPSFSSSRRMLGVILNNTSSTSLLSHSAIDNSESPNRSTTNLNRHQRNISAPLQARRLQFVPPAAGFSERQMQFLTSVESLDRYGVPLQQEQHQDVPPSFEELARDQERSVLPIAHSAPSLTPAEIYQEEARTPLASLPIVIAPSEVGDTTDTSPSTAITTSALAPSTTTTTSVS